MLLQALLVFLAAAPVSGEGLPRFDLDSIHLKDLREHAYNSEIADGARLYDMIPNAPEPVFVRVDGGPMPKLPESGPETYQIYGDGPDVPPPLSKAGYMRMTSSTKLKMDREKGELTVAFPEVHFAGGAFGDNTDLFVRLTGSAASPSISWAAVMCSGGKYIGYKGATVGFPTRSGSYSVKETLALGSPKALINRTHGWLTTGLMTLDDMCSEGFRERMKNARAETLPSNIGNLNFVFSSREKTLKVKW